MARGSIKGITIELNGDTSKLGTALQDVNKQARDTTSELRQVNNALKFDPGNTELIAQKQRVLQDAVTATKDKLDVLAEADRQAKIQLENGELGQEDYDALRREIIKTEGQLDSYTKQLAETDAALGKQKKSLQDVADGFKESGEKMQDVGKKLSVGITAPLMAVATAAGVAWGEIDDALDGIATATGATGDAMEGFEQVFREAYGALPAEAQKVGAAVGELNTQFGLQGDALTAATEKAVKFAEINGADVVKSVQGAKGVISMMGLETEDLGHVLDVVTKAAQDTGIGVDSLFNSMQKSGPQMKALGLSTGEVAMLLGHMEQAGLESTKVLAGLTRAQVNASKEGKDLSTALSEFTAMANSSASETEKLAAASALFGTRNGPLMLEAARQGVLDFDALGEAVGDAGGLVEQTFEEILDPVDNMKVALNNFKLAGADLFTTIQVMGTPALEGLADGARKLAEWLNNLDPEAQKMVITLAAAAAAAGPATFAIGKLTSGIGSAIEVVGKMTESIGEKGFMGALSSGIGPAGKIMLAVAAIAALVAVGKKIYDEFKPGTEEIRNFVDASEELRQSYGDEKKLADATADATRRKIDELSRLSNQTHRTAEEQTRMNLLVKELNQMYPELNLALDQNTGKLKQSTEEISRQVEMMLRRLDAELLEKQIFDLKERSAELTKQQTNATEELADAQSRYDEKYENTAMQWIAGIPIVGEMNEKVTAWGVGLTDAQQNLELLNNDISENDAEIERLIAQYHDLTGETGEYANALGETAAQEKQTGDARKQNADEVISKIAEASAEAFRIRRESKDDIEAYHAAVQSSQQSHINSIQGFADKEFDIRKATAAELMEHQKKMLAAYMDYEQNMAILSRKVPADVLAELRKLGPDGAALVAEYVNMTDDELQPYIATWSSVTETALDAAKEELKTMPGAAASAALDTVNETILELKRGPRETRAAMRETIQQFTDEGEGLVHAGRTRGKEAADAIKDELDKAPPAARTSGAAAGQSYKEGIDSKQSEIKKAGSDAGASAKSGFNVSGYASGQNVGQTFANGILSKVGVVKGAGKTLGAAAPDGLKHVLQIHSPSRVMAGLADDTVDGYENKLIDRVKDVKRAGEKLVEPMTKLATDGPAVPAITAGLAGISAGAAGSVQTSETFNVTVQAATGMSGADARQIGRLVYEGYRREKAMRGGA